MRSTSFKTAESKEVCVPTAIPLLSATLVRQLPYYLFRETCFMDSCLRGAFFYDSSPSRGRRGGRGGGRRGGREHALGHVEIAPDLDLVDLKRQVSGVARFDVQIVERRALIEVLREAVRVEPDGLTAQIGEVVAVEVPARAVEQITLESPFRWPADSGRRYCRRRLRRSAAGARIAGRTAPCRAICSKMAV